MDGSGGDEYWPTPAFPVTEGVDANIRDYLKSVSSEGDEVDLICRVQAIAGSIGDAF